MQANKPKSPNLARKLYLPVSRYGCPGDRVRCPGTDLVDWGSLQPCYLAGFRHRTVAVTLQGEGVKKHTYFLISKSHKN